MVPLLVVLVGAATALIVTQGDDEGSDVIAGSPDTTASREDTTTSTAAPAPVVDVPAEPPAGYVGVTDAGLLVQVDRGTSVVTELANAGDPAEPGSQESGPRYIESAVLSPDAASVYYAQCCEPAVGSIYRLSVGGEAERVYDGSPAAISPDGRYLAVPQGPFGVAVHELGTYNSRLIASTSATTYVRSVNFTPAGDALVVGLSELDQLTTVAVVSTDADSLDDAVRLQPPEGAAWSNPVQASDAQLYVLETDAAGTRLVHVDPDGTGRQEIDLGGRAVRSIASDASGGWLIAALEGGGVAIVGPDHNLFAVEDGTVYAAIDW